MPPTLSVVIPLGPGENAWRPLLQQLAALPSAGSETILVGAGVDPPDVPVPISGLRVRRLRAPVGRARQMNAGAAAAQGRWLWFLHADSRLSPAVLPALHAFLTGHVDALGYFDLAFADDGPRLARLNAAGANLRARWLGLPFGDQGLVLPRRHFTDLGGYDETAPYGEDHLLVWRARRARLPLVRIPARLYTSARKYRDRGWAATTLRHLWRTAAQALPRAMRVSR